MSASLQGPWCELQIGSESASVGFWELATLLMRIAVLLMVGEPKNWALVQRGWLPSEQSELYHPASPMVQPLHQCLLGKFLIWNFVLKRWLLDVQTVIVNIFANSVSRILALSSHSVVRPLSVCHQAWHPSISPLYDILDHTNQIFSESWWHPLSTDPLPTPPSPTQTHHTHKTHPQPT